MDLTQWSHRSSHKITTRGFEMQCKQIVFLANEVHELTVKIWKYSESLDRIDRMEIGRQLAAFDVLIDRIVDHYTELEIEHVRINIPDSIDYSLLSSLAPTYQVLLLRDMVDEINERVEVLQKWFSIN